MHILMWGKRRAHQGRQDHLTGHKRRVRRGFIPQSPDGRGVARLESRELTTGAFWRYPPGAAPTTDLVWAAMFAGGWDGLNNQTLVNDTDSQPVSAIAGGLANHVSDPTISYWGPESIQAMGLVTTNVWDTAQLGSPGSTPVGDYLIQFNTSNQLDLATDVDYYPYTGIDMDVTTESIVNRNYMLANDADGASNFLVEHYNIHFSGMYNIGVYTFDTQARIDTGSGFEVSWTPFLTTIGPPGDVYLLPGDSGTDTYTDPSGGTYTFSYSLTWNTADLDVVYVKPVSSLGGTMPTQATTIAGITGLQYEVASTARMAYTISPGTDFSEIDVLTTQFDAHFV